MQNIKEIISYTKKLNLLYVEDNEEARETTLMVFENFFDNIMIAVDGNDGYEKFSSNKIDIIITDINMPNLNGIDMISKIREKNRDIPILVLSAHNESEYFIDCIKLGVEGYLLKPIDTKQLLDVIEKITNVLKLKEESAKNLLFLQQYEDITDQSSIVSKTDTSGIITYVNDEFCKISGFSRDELIGKSHKMIRHPDNPSSVYKNMWDIIKNKKQIWKGLLRNRSKDGSSHYVKMTIKPIVDQNNEIVEYIALRDDVTAIMNPKKQLEVLLDTTKNIFAMMIKIDQFDELEKLYGEHITRKVEDDFASILLKNKPEVCNFETIYPLGNGKYIFATNKDECSKDIDSILDNIKEFQKIINYKTLQIDDFRYDITILISVAYGENILENLHYGIEKLEVTKEKFIIANGLANDIQQTAKKNMKTISMVKTAIEHNNIVSYFQPIINNSTKKIAKYESLVRLIDEDGKVLSPFFFLETSKKGRYYTQITHIVLDNSFEMLKYIDEDISMNISALDIEHPATQKYIFELLERYKEYASRVVFELLEDENVNDFDTIKNFINDVKKYGVKIAIDDFGAGYSNYERLLDYQPDILKIDGCLIRNILDDEYSLSIVETIVAFAKKQNIQTVAEFIENEDIYNLINDVGVDYSQGYFFGKPQVLNKK